jgi:cell fate (sporulation/competence/biofilm development) regulator YlbF (YheA/YmcA/DUF963 family)
MSQISTKRSRLFVLAALVFLFPARAFAIPIADYQQNLKKAITALDTLTQSDEDENPVDYGVRFKQTIDGVRAVLPEHQTVESPDGVYEVDNSWLHKDLKAAEEAVDSPEHLRHILESLQAVEARIAEQQNAHSSAENKGWAKTRLESILARPEYVTGARGPNAFSRLLQELFRWLEGLFPKRAPMDPGRANLITQIAQIIVILAALFLIIYVIKILFMRLQRMRKRKTPKKRKARIVLGERLEPEQTSSDLLSEAEALARNGDLRAAIRKAYIALLVELGDRKLISLAQHKTNRDYLNSLRNTPQLHSRMRGLTESFERHWYGLAQATPNDWQDFRTGYLSTLQTGS